MPKQSSPSALKYPIFVSTYSRDGDKAICYQTPPPHHNTITSPIIFYYSYSNYDSHYNNRFFYIVFYCIYHLIPDTPIEVLIFAIDKLEHRLVTILWFLLIVCSQALIWVLLIRFEIRIIPTHGSSLISDDLMIRTRINVSLSTTMFLVIGFCLALCDLASSTKDSLNGSGSGGNSSFNNLETNDSKEDYIIREYFIYRDRDDDYGDVIDTDPNLYKPLNDEGHLESLNARKKLKYDKVLFENNRKSNYTRVKSTDKHLDSTILYTSHPNDMSRSRVTSNSVGPYHNTYNRNATIMLPPLVSGRKVRARAKVITKHGNFSLPRSANRTGKSTPKPSTTRFNATKPKPRQPSTSSSFLTNSSTTLSTTITTHSQLPNSAAGNKKQGGSSGLKIDMVTQFLKIVEEYEQDIEHCNAGTTVNLGEGVIDQYGLKRYYSQALIAVNRANLLTRLWKYGESEVLASEYFLYSLVRSMVESDENIFAAGNCYDAYEYKDYYLYCPFAHYLPQGNQILVKDLSVQYKYMGNDSEWFHSLKVYAKNLANFHKIKGVYRMRYNGSADGVEKKEEILAVSYKDGHWSKPYFDCGGGNIWMMTYTIPFFGFKNGEYYFKGTSGIDIDLRKVDIDQCPQGVNDTSLNVFAGSDKCQENSTVCVPVEGQGFRRGSYLCKCKKGFYFPYKDKKNKYFVGTEMEVEYEKYVKEEPNQYDEMICLPCPPDCEDCEEYKPCSVITNKILRTIILCLQCLVMGLVPVLVWFTWTYREIKVVKASSPTLLIIFLAGTLFLYLPVIVSFPEPSTITCTLKIWFREFGFAIAYGALLLKTWRIAMVFRVRSAQKIKITDLSLIKRMGIIVVVFLGLVMARTIITPAGVTTIYNRKNLKAYLCVTDWWDYSIAIGELTLLLWGIKLSFDVRKAPSEFNESKYISMAIYNEFLLSLFLNISLFFLQTYGDPDLLYIILFVHSQLTTTVLLCLIFGSKIYVIYKGLGNKQDDSSSKNKFFHKKTPNTTQITSLLSQSDNGTGLLKDQDIQTEIKRLYVQMEIMRVQNMRLGNRHIPGFHAASVARAKRHGTIKKGVVNSFNFGRKWSGEALLGNTPSAISHTSKIIKNRLTKTASVMARNSRSKKAGKTFTSKRDKSAIIGRLKKISPPISPSTVVSRPSLSDSEMAMANAIVKLNSQIFSPTSPGDTNLAQLIQSSIFLPSLSNLQNSRPPSLSSLTEYCSRDEPEPKTSHDLIRNLSKEIKDAVLKPEPIVNGSVIDGEKLSASHDKTKLLTSIETGSVPQSNVLPPFAIPETPLAPKIIDSMPHMRLERVITINFDDTDVQI